MAPNTVSSKSSHHLNHVPRKCQFREASYRQPSVPEGHLSSSNAGLVRLMGSHMVLGKESPRWVAQRHPQETISGWKEEEER